MVVYLDRQCCVPGQTVLCTWTHSVVYLDRKISWLLPSDVTQDAISSRLGGFNRSIIVFIIVFIVVFIVLITLFIILFTVFFLTVDVDPRQRF